MSTSRLSGTSAGAGNKVESASGTRHCQSVSLLHSCYVVPLTDVFGLGAVEANSPKELALGAAGRVALFAVEALAASFQDLASCELVVSCLPTYHDTVNGDTTLSPFLKFFTLSPTSEITPVNSCPMMKPVPLKQAVRDRVCKRIGSRHLPRLMTAVNMQLTAGSSVTVNDFRHTSCTYLPHSAVYSTLQMTSVGNFILSMQM